MVTSWPLMRWRGPVVTEEDVAAFERYLGRALPEDYRRFLLEVNGGRPAPSNALYSRGIINSFFSLNDTDKGNDLLDFCIYARDPLPCPDLLYVGCDAGALILIAVTGGHRGEVWVQNIANPRLSDSSSRVHWCERRDMEKLANNFEQFVGTLQPI